MLLKPGVLVEEFLELDWIIPWDRVTLEVNELIHVCGLAPQTTGRFRRMCGQCVWIRGAYGMMDSPTVVLLIAEICKYLVSDHVSHHPCVHELCIPDKYQVVRMKVMMIELLDTMIVWNSMSLEFLKYPEPKVPVNVLAKLVRIYTSKFHSRFQPVVHDNETCHNVYQVAVLIECLMPGILWISLSDGLLDHEVPACIGHKRFPPHSRVGVLVSS